MLSTPSGWMIVPVIVGLGLEGPGKGVAGGLGLDRVERVRLGDQAQEAQETGGDGHFLALLFLLKDKSTRQGFPSEVWPRNSRPAPMRV